MIRKSMILDAVVTGAVFTWALLELQDGDAERAGVLFLLVATRIRFVILEERVRREEVALAAVEARDAQRDLI